MFQPHVTVASIICRDNRFLLVKEMQQGLPVYNQPAGHVEANESILDACIRETLEETGYQCTPEYLVGIYHLAIDKGPTYFRFCFYCNCDEYPATSTLDPDIIEAQWLSYDEIIANQHMLRSPLVLRCIEDFRAGQQFALSSIAPPVCI